MLRHRVRHVWNKSLHTDVHMSSQRCRDGARGRHRSPSCRLKWMFTYLDNIRGNETSTRMPEKGTWKQEGDPRNTAPYQKKFCHCSFRSVWIMWPSETSRLGESLRRPDCQAQGNSDSRLVGREFTGSPVQREAQDRDTTDMLRSRGPRSRKIASRGDGSMIMCFSAWPVWQLDGERHKGLSRQMRGIQIGARSQSNWVSKRQSPYAQNLQTVVSVGEYANELVLPQEFEAISRYGALKSKSASP